MNYFSAFQFLLAIKRGTCINTADNLSNAKPAVQQRHPGD